MSTFTVSVGFSMFHENAPPWRTAFRVIEHDHELGDGRETVVLALQIQACTPYLPNRACRVLGDRAWSTLQAAYEAIHAFAASRGIEHRLEPLSTRVPLSPATARPLV